MSTMITKDDKAGSLQQEVKDDPFYSCRVSLEEIRNLFARHLPNDTWMSPRECRFLGRRMPKFGWRGRDGKGIYLVVSERMSGFQARYQHAVRINLEGQKGVTYLSEHRGVRGPGYLAARRHIWQLLREEEQSDDGR